MREKFTLGVAVRSALTVVRDVRWQALINPIPSLDKRLERFLPDHSITRRLVKWLRAETSEGQSTPSRRCSAKFATTCGHRARHRRVLRHLHEIHPRHVHCRREIHRQHGHRRRIVRRHEKMACRQTRQRTHRGTHSRDNNRTRDSTSAPGTGNSSTPAIPNVLGIHKLVGRPQPQETARLRKQR
jgi:hypothetical protein